MKCLRIIVDWGEEVASEVGDWNNFNILARATGVLTSLDEDGTFEQLRPDSDRILKDLLGRIERELKEKQ